MKILLIDDSNLILRYVSELLISQGHVVIIATNFAEAAQAFVQSRPEALLVDFILGPNRTGLEVLKALAVLPNGKNTPAAILTQGSLTKADQAKALELGYEILQKPVRGKEDEFLESIKAWHGRLATRL